MAEAAAEVKETVSIDTLDMAEFKEARKAGTLTVEKPVEAEPEKKAEEEKPKSKGGGFQKRIDRLVKHSASQEQTIADLQAKLAAKESGKEKETVKAAGDDPEPSKDDFTDYDAYIKAQAKWEVRQELKAEKQKESQAAEQARSKEIFDTYNEKVVEAKSRYEDWDEVIGKNTLEIPKGSIMAIYEQDNGPDVAYFVASHPEVIEKLRDATIIGAIRIVEQISIELAKENPDVEEEDDEEQEEEKEKEEKKLTSKAPTPIKPVSSGATKSTKPLDQMDYQEYKKAKAAGRAK